MSKNFNDNHIPTWNDLLNPMPKKKQIAMIEDNNSNECPFEHGSLINGKWLEHDSTCLSCTKKVNRADYVRIVGVSDYVMKYIADGNFDDMFRGIFIEEIDRRLGIRGYVHSNCAHKFKLNQMLTYIDVYNDRIYPQIIMPSTPVDERGWLSDNTKNGLEERRKWQKKAQMINQWARAHGMLPKKIRVRTGVTIINHINEDDKEFWASFTRVAKKIAKGESVR